MIDIKNTSLQELEHAIKMKRLQLLEQQQLRSNEDLVHQFLESLNSNATRRNYKSRIRKFCEFINKNLQLVTKFDLEQYFQYLNHKRINDKTSAELRKNSKLSLLHTVQSFYQYFLHLQEIDKDNIMNLHFIENPLSNFRRKWKRDWKQSDFDILISDELKLVLADLKKMNIRYYLMVYIMADTSMRPQGMLNIMVDNINFEKRIIKTFDKDKWRKYAFGMNLRAELFNFLTIRKNIKTKYSNSPYLFFSRKAEHYSMTWLSGHLFPEKISPLIHELTGKKITAHSFRRSFRTNRTNLGQERNQVESLMDHLTGLDLSYVHPPDEMLLEWFDSYEQL